MSERSEPLSRRLRALVDELVEGGVTLEQARGEFEKQYVLAALRANSGSLAKSANSLGIHRNTLRNKMTSLRIVSADYAPSRRRR